MYKVRKAQSSSKKNQISTGWHSAVVVSVAEPKGFRAGDALDIVYDVDDNGERKQHQERFFMKGESERRDRLDKILDALGFQTYDDFVATKLDLYFQHEVNYGRSFLNVSEYKLTDESYGNCDSLGKGGEK